VLLIKFLYTACANVRDCCLNRVVIEQGKVKPAVVAQIRNRDRVAATLHALSAQQPGRVLAAQVSPAQQFSVRKPIKPVMASKFAV
jgi:hypothetical protein